MKTLNPVVHFEMPYKKAERVKDFYEKVFGWEMKQFGEEMGNYITADTGESTPQGPTQPGYINGGFFPYSDDEGRNKPSLVVSVDDIQAAMENVKKAGGTVIGEPTNIPGVGLWVPFTDTEGNRGSLLQAARP